MEGCVILRRAMYLIVLLEIIVFSSTPVLARFSTSHSQSQGHQTLTLNKVDSTSGYNHVNNDINIGPTIGRNRTSAIPPRLLNTMMRLTERGVHRNAKKGDTIRAYTPFTSRICDGHVVSSFNIRLHPLTEDLRAIELHYYKLPESLRHRGDSFQVVLWSLQANDNDGCTRIGALNLRNNRRGYQTIDVTSELSDQWDYLPESAMVGVSFRTRDGGESAEMNRLDSATSSASTRPFVLVYTNQRKRSNIGSLHKTMQEAQTRRRRSVIPDLDLSNHIGPLGPSSPRGEPVMAHQTQVNHVQQVGPGRSAGSNQLSFEYFNDQNKLRRKMLRKRRKHQKLGLAEGGEGVSNNELPLPASEGRCQRHPLLVNFRDLGWDDFVIAPLVYDATYCAGTCSQSNVEDVGVESPSNYAAILNVMGTLGVAPAPLPAPCCAPEKMSSMSLLYFDENLDISLKTFSDMIVNSCSCR